MAVSLAHSRVQPSDSGKTLRYKRREGLSSLVNYHEAASIHLHNAVTGVQLLSSLCVAGASACCYELYLQSDWSRVCRATVRMQITVGVQLRK